MPRIISLRRSIELVIVSTCMIAGIIAPGVFAVRYVNPPPPPLHDVASGHKPDIAADKSGTLHVVYEATEEKSQTPDIFYSRSTDGGVTWSPGVAISRTPGASNEPDVTVDSKGGLDVVWRDTSPGEQSSDIFFARSADGGKTWTNAADISNTPGASTEPAISCGTDGSIHVVWIDATPGPTHPDVYYCASTNAGESWSKAEDVSNTPGVSSQPDVAVADDGTVQVAWTDTTPGPTHPDIYHARKSGDAWGKPEDVSNTPRISDHPRLATGPKGRTYLCWQDNAEKKDAPDIWCAIAGSDGHWTKTLNISDTPGVSSKPCIAADQGGRVVLVWVDTTSGASPDVCARISLDNAEHFSNPMNLSHTLGKSTQPEIALSGSRMFTVWEEIVGAKSTVKTMSFELKKFPNGPLREVDAKARGSKE